MITEDYVNKQIALLLREKGFDEPTLYHYNGDNKEPTHTINYDLLKNSELKEFCSAAPTVQMVMKWLREVHKIFINVSNEVSLTDDDITYRFFVCTKEKTILHRGEDIKTFEGACNEAMKFAIENLI